MEKLCVDGLVIQQDPAKVNSDALSFCVVPFVLNV